MSMNATRTSLFLLGVCTWGLVSCGTSETQQQQGSAKGPIEVLSPSGSSSSTDQLTTIAWLDSTYWNAGQIEEGAKLAVAFRFKNNGTKPLVIESVTASCGCTAPEPPKRADCAGQRRGDCGNL